MLRRGVWNYLECQVLGEGKPLKKKEKNMKEHVGNLVFEREREKGSRRKKGGV